MRLKQHFECMPVMHMTVAVPMDNGSFRGVLRLNKTAAAIVELLKEETSEEAIVDALAERFDAPRDTLAKDVERVIAMLREKDLLV